MSKEQESNQRKRLYLNKEEGKVFGVASGLADYFDVDVVFVRLALVLVALLFKEIVIFYIIASYIIPEKHKEVNVGEDNNSYYEKGDKGFVAEEESGSRESGKSYYEKQEEFDLDDILADRPSEEKREEKVIIKEVWEKEEGTSVDSKE